MTTLRVLYSFPHAVGRPGIATTAFNQVRALAGAGVDITVVCTSAARRLPGVEVIETLRVAGRRIPHRALGVSRAYAYHDRRAAGVLRRRPGHFDVIHTWPGACLHTMGAAQVGGPPVVREVPSPHTALAVETAGVAFARAGVTMPPGHSHRPDPLRLARELREFEAADALLLPSPHLVDGFVAAGIPASRLLVTRYGADLDVFVPHTGGAARRPFTAVFAGRGEPSKGLDLALRAWVASGAATHGRLIICGAVLPEFAAQLSDLLHHRSVELRGFEPDMAGTFASADVLVLPTLTEGSALVTYEAQAAGAVLVVSDAAGAQCVPGRTGLVHPAGDLAALTADLASLAGDPGLLARMRAGVLATRHELGWEAAAGSLVAAYRTVLEMDRPTAPGASRP